MCVEIFLKILKYLKVCCFYFLKDSAKFQNNINYVLYAFKICVSPKYSIEKIYYVLYAWNVRVF